MRKYPKHKPLALEPISLLDRSAGNRRRHEPRIRFNASLVFAVMSVAFQLAMTGKAFGNEPDHAFLTLDEIYDQATAAAKELKTVRVVYDAQRKCPLRLPAMAKAPLLEYSSRITVVHLGDERRYLEEVSPSFGQPPFNRHLGFFNGSTTVSYQGTGLLIMNGKFARVCESSDSYLTWFLGIELSDSDRASGVDVVYPKCLKSVGGFFPSYRVLPDLEEAEGVQCHVLEAAPNDKIWIDGKRNCAVVRREVRSGSKNHNVLAFSTVASNFVKHGSNLWIPQKCVYTSFPPIGFAPEAHNKPMYVIEMSVDSVRLNDVSESDMVLNIPEGTSVTDIDGKTYQLGSDNIELLRKYASVNATKKTNWPRVLAIVIIVIAIASTLAYLLMRRRRRARGAHE